MADQCYSQFFQDEDEENVPLIDRCAKATLDFDAYKTIQMLYTMLEVPWVVAHLADLMHKAKLVSCHAVCRHCLRTPSLKAGTPCSFASSAVW